MMKRTKSFTIKQSIYIDFVNPIVEFLGFVKEIYWFPSINGM